MPAPVPVERGYEVTQRKAVRLGPVTITLERGAVKQNYNFDCLPCKWPGPRIESGWRIRLWARTVWESHPSVASLLALHGGGGVGAGGADPDGVAGLGGAGGAGHPGGREHCPVLTAARTPPAQHLSQHSPHLLIYVYVHRQHLETTLNRKKILQT